jgi:hypothetical protein
MINRLLSFFLCALLIFPSCTKQDRKCIALDELKQFYSCSTVDWAKLDTLYYRPYNCDWSDEIGAQIHPDFPPEYAAKYWLRLQNAKTYFHQQTLPLRSGASEEFIAQLNHTESAFDSVFVHIVNQEYYMRLFVDNYEEIMPQEIDKCFEELK